MLLADYLLPGTIMMIKFIMRLTVDQEMTASDTARALLLFPIDIAFLALSYGSAVLYLAPPEAPTSNTIKVLIVIILMAFFLLYPVVILAKRAERNFAREKFGKLMIQAGIAYVLSLSIITLSTTIGRFL